MTNKIKEELERILKVEQYDHPPQTRPIAKRSIGVKPKEDDDNRYTFRDDDNEREVEIYGGGHVEGF
jgi:hypothetical protein